MIAFDPVELAGGHSFETDLIEIAGGTSVTHGGEETRLELRKGHWAELAPDLILVVSPETPGPKQRAAARNALPPDTPVDFFVFDRQGAWLRDAELTAQRLRTLLIGKTLLGHATDR